MMHIYYVTRCFSKSLFFKYISNCHHDGDNKKPLSSFFLTVVRDAEKRETKFPPQPLEMVENFLMRLPILNKISDIIKADLHGTTLSHNTSLRQAYDINRFL